MNVGAQRPTSLPHRFVGVWRRRSVSIDGCAPHEPSFAVWMQGRPEFADVRWRLQPDDHGPLCEDQAFAGWTTWDMPYLTWHHCVDRTPAPTEDRGRIDLVGDVLVERGTTRRSSDGPRLQYEEVWDRIEDGPVSLVRRPTATAPALRIESPTLALELEERGRNDQVVARLERRDADGTWLLERELG
jgi:hypothetical protein